MMAVFMCLTYETYTIPSVVVVYTHVSNCMFVCLGPVICPVCYNCLQGVVLVVTLGLGVVIAPWR